MSGLLSDLAGRKVTVIIGATTCFIGGSLQVSSFYLWLESETTSPIPSPICSSYVIHVVCFDILLHRMLLPGRIISGIGTGYEKCSVLKSLIDISFTLESCCKLVHCMWLKLLRRREEGPWSPCPSLLHLWLRW